MKNISKILSFPVFVVLILMSIRLDAQTVSAGQSHTIAICKSGGVMAWGLNTDGEVGDSTRTNRYYPSGNNKLTSVIAVVAGTDHSAALKADGTVMGGRSRKCLDFT
jgi:alpha-tubulin suppressor-like RCC1 family protein